MAHRKYQRDRYDKYQQQVQPTLSGRRQIC
ncbi:hypothetical protein EMIT0111MI5_30154 [Burkholderia sp. IT-111MI5]